jgi:hypothetical protein
MSKAKPRRERSCPQNPRCFSLASGKSLDSVGNTWVPLADVRELQRRYANLFRRYQRNAMLAASRREGGG